VAALFLLFASALGLAGCGHATVPCPTPTDQLDRLRGETERLREDTERAQAEEAQARLDSLMEGRRR